MKILFHICCSNCILYPFRLLKAEGHDLTGFWYNPNIHPYDEYCLRLDSLRKLSVEWRLDIFYDEVYRPDDFFDKIMPASISSVTRSENPRRSLRGRQSQPKRSHETGSEQVHQPDQLEISSPLARNDKNSIPISPERCKSCYLLRLEKTAATAHDEGFEAFSTTLLISPYQDFEHINTAGRELAEKYDLTFYMKDFRPYFRDTMSLAKELGLYRQKYCGCLFSKQERENAVRAKEVAKANQKRQYPE